MLQNQTFITCETVRWVHTTDLTQNKNIKPKNWHRISQMFLVQLTLFQSVWKFCLSPYIYGSSNLTCNKYLTSFILHSEQSGYPHKTFYKTSFSPHLLSHMSGKLTLWKPQWKDRNWRVVGRLWAAPPDGSGRSFSYRRTSSRGRKFVRVCVQVEVKSSQKPLVTLNPFSAARKLTGSGRSLMLRPLDALKINAFLDHLP